MEKSEKIFDQNLSRFEYAKEKALQIITSFPKSKNWHYFLCLPDGRKVFFSIFIKKYGLDGTKNKYSVNDVLRRIRVIEFFDYMIKDNKIIEQKSKNILIESVFWRMVIGRVGKIWKQKLEMISFYHHI